MPPREEVSFQRTLARAARRGPRSRRPSGARCSSTGSMSAIQALSVALNTAWSPSEVVSSGPNRRNDSGFEPMTSRISSPRTRVASAVVPTGARDRHGLVAEVRQAEIAEQEAAIRMGVGAHPTLARRSEGAPIRCSVPPSSKSSSGRSRGIQRLEEGETGRVVATSAIGTGRACHVPRPASPPPPPARSHPSGGGARSSAGAGVPLAPLPSLCLALDVGELRRGRSPVWGQQACSWTSAGTVAGDCLVRTSYPKPVSTGGAAPLRGFGRSPRGWRSCSR